MNVKRIARLGLLVLIAASVNGCGTSTWSHRDTNPSIKDEVYTTGLWSRWFGNPRSVSTFATTASRRVIIWVRLKADWCLVDQACLERKVELLRWPCKHK
jgi:hypothetical protein